MLTHAELVERVRGGTIDTVVVAFPDLLGRLMGKRVAAPFFLDEVAGRGMHVCNYLLTVDMEMEPLPGFQLASWDKGYGDFHAAPDLATLRVLPWAPRTALVLCDLEHPGGAPVEESPRRVLRRQIEKLRAAGFSARIGAELEFFLFRESYDQARAKGWHGLTPSSAYRQDYHLLRTARDEPIIAQIRAGMEAAGVPVESSKGEWGCGQHEINLRYAEPLEMADRVVIYKNGAKEIAATAGQALTFMAKVDERDAGSSFHLHASLWDADGASVFWKDGAETPLLGHALAGMMEAARPLAYLYAPEVNSYKRYQAASWAPTRVAWGRDNRTCGFRLLGREGGCRIENRLPGADANPYFVMAAAIAAMLDGIARKLSPPPELAGNAYEAREQPRVPGTLRDALDALEASAMAREAFGEPVVRHLAHFGRLEQASFDRVVTCWERARNFERI